MNCQVIKKKKTNQKTEDKKRAKKYKKVEKISRFWEKKVKGKCVCIICKICFVGKRDRVIVFQTHKLVSSLSTEVINKDGYF